MTIALFVIAAFVLLFAGLPIAAIIALIGLALSALTPVPISGLLGMTAWTQSQDYILVSVPLFILFGEILVRSGIAGEMYDAVSPWLNRLPGKLMQTNIATCAIFAATSGSSVATAATVGAVAIPQIQRFGYNERLFLGSIAAGGTLGILIPPSINMIVFGAITNTSIPQLYLAGFVPGIILTGAFMTVTAIACLLRPDWDGKSMKASWADRMSSLPALLPPLAIFLIVVGSIYAGIATPTEAAALGVGATILLAAVKRRLTVKLINTSLLSTARTTSMLLLILIAASFLNFALAFLGFARELERLIFNLDLTPYQVIFGIIVFYIILGCFLDALPMTLLTAPTLTPIVVKLGFDPVWFGIIVVIVSETGLITPPVGMNCYVVQGVRGRGALHDVFIGVIPYLFALFFVVALVAAVPQTALWLPHLFSSFQH